MIRTRFAPSPNGPLHLGHAFAAIVAHDLARERAMIRKLSPMGRGLGEGIGALAVARPITAGHPHSGPLPEGEGEKFLLRIEDIDGTRSRPELAEAILADLAWLGLAWDGPVVRQSERLADYGVAAERLRAAGLLYPCQCTRAEIAAAATQVGPEGPIYPGTCRGRHVEAQGAAWRLDVAAAMALAGPLAWVDELAGPQAARPDLFGDVVLVRKDAPASYHLAATLDDAADGITLVTRGQDLFAATHIHRLLQALLGLPVPVWHHHGLLLDGQGQKLAKRRGSPSLSERRRAGEDGIALAAALRAGRFGTGISFRSGVEFAA